MDSGTARLIAGGCRPDAGPATLHHKACLPVLGRKHPALGQPIPACWNRLDQGIGSEDGFLGVPPAPEPAAPWDSTDPITATECRNTDRDGEATILVADENPDVRSYVAEVLRPWWHVVVARDGVEALTTALNLHPALVLTDIRMPHLDGFGLLVALRDNPRTAATPVVLCSVSTTRDAAIEGLGMGADDYLIKPLSPVELISRVRSNLELARLRRRESAWRSALVESLGQGVAVADSTGTVVEVNDEFARVLGFGRQGAPYPPPHPWWPDPAADPEGRARVEAVLKSVLAHSTGHYVLPLRHRDGHRVWVEVMVSSVADPLEAEPMLVAEFRDVTAELAAEQRRGALGRLTARLSSAEDTASVIEAGLAELQSLFAASVAIITTWAAGGEPSVTTALDATSWDTVDNRARTALVSARETGQLHPELTDGPERIRGVAAPTGASYHPSAVWLEFDPPRPLAPDERSLLAVLCGFLGQALDRAQLFDQQRKVAVTLQHAILGPTDLPTGLATRYVPAVRPLEVGGDWYDVVELPDRRMALVVGDCVGSGLDAAAVMGQLRSGCRALLLAASGSPSTTLSALDTFAARIPDALCASVFCAIVDTAAGSIRYSCAGHPPAVIVHPDGTSELLDDTRCVPLAVLPAVSRPEASAILRPGSTLLLYTDGLIERRREDLDVGINRLREAMVTHRAAPPDRLADRLLQTLLPGNGQEDDVALLIYQHRPLHTPGPDA